MGAVAAGTSGTAAADGGGNGDAVSFAEAFGNSAEGVFTSAALAPDRSIGLAETPHFFEFIVAVFADIFVNRHNSLLMVIIILTGRGFRRFEVTSLTVSGMLPSVRLPGSARPP